MMIMDKLGEKQNSNALGAAHINKIPAEIVGRFLQKLSVRDRKECEGVSPHWNRIVSKLGWIEQAKLNRDIVFEGKNEEEISRFWENSSGQDVRNLFVSLFDFVRHSLVELDLHSFEVENLEPFAHKFAKSIQRCSKLERIDIRRFSLNVFVNHLPRTLRMLKTSYGISFECLQTLSRRCPNLEEVPFRHLHHRYQRVKYFTLYKLINLIGKFPRQKRLHFYDLQLTSGKPGRLGFYSSIGQLTDLVKLELWRCSSVDGKSFEAIVKGCQNLEFFSLDVRHLSEQTLFLLAKIPKLRVLELNDPNETFSDAVLQAIAQRGQLKRLYLGMLEGGSPITDDAVVYLLDRCKSLVSLSFCNCYELTKRSFEAVVAEVRRRHGVPPRSLPTGPRDPGVFYFTAYDTEIDPDSAMELVGDNPWLRVYKYDDRERDDEEDY